jgi:hypothetical protein
MSEITEQSRRGFLAALATTGIGVAAATGLAHAEDGEPAGAGGAGTPGGAPGPGALTEAYPAPTPGTSYLYLSGAEFYPQSSTADYSKSFGQVQSTAGGVFYRPLSELPHGARITEVVAAVVKSGAAANTSFFFYRFFSGGIDLLDNKDSTTFGVSATEQNISLTVANTDQWVIDNSLAYTHWLVATLSANGRLNSVRVGYINPTPPFHPISPKRVYDSRLIAPLGPLPNLANRVVSVANGYETGTATIDTPNVVPVGASAIAYNITIANTVGSGFLSVNPGDATAIGGSSINWFQSGLVLANGLVVKLDGSRQIKVFCGGGGSTDFIIDILGYYL